MGTQIFNKCFRHKYIRLCPLIFQANQHLTSIGPRDGAGQGWSSLGRMLSILTSIQWCLPFVLPHIFQLIRSWRGKTKQKLPKFPQLIVSLFKYFRPKFPDCFDWFGTWLVSPEALCDVTLQVNGTLNSLSFNGNLLFTKQDFPLQLWEVSSYLYPENQQT